MVARSNRKWTVEEYLQFERESDERHEFYGSEIYLMTGASERHVLITGNTFSSLHSQLRRTPCRIYAVDMRVKVSATGLYTYPDISVVCGEPAFEDEHVDTLINPTVIVEVLSPSTERYDRGKKFQHYRTLKSLQEYILIGQDNPQIEQFTRTDNDRWLLNTASQLDAQIELSAIGCTLLVADVYEKVTFEPGEADEA